MDAAFRRNAARLATILVAVVILKVTASVVWGYREYFPPNFQSDFLLGRQSYFAGAYQWAFYSHILAGPFTLVFGLILLSDRFRLRFPKWHRGIGKLQVVLIVVLLCPSGLWMAGYAQTGAIAGVGFAVLAVATSASALFGWRTAVQRRFAEHRRWMLRCFILLCSAVVLRLMGGFVEVTGFGVMWAYPLASWASWLLPLGIYELTSVIARTNCSNRSPRDNYSPLLPSFGLRSSREASFNNSAAEISSVRN